MFVFPFYILEMMAFKSNFVECEVKNGLLLLFAKLFVYLLFFVIFYVMFMFGDVGGVFIGVIYIVYFYFYFYMLYYFYVLFCYYWVFYGLFSVFYAYCCWSVTDNGISTLILCFDCRTGFYFFNYELISLILLIIFFFLVS